MNQLIVGIVTLLIIIALPMVERFLSHGRGSEAPPGLPVIVSRAGHRVGTRPPVEHLMPQPTAGVEAVEPDDSSDPHFYYQAAGQADFAQVATTSGGLNAQMAALLRSLQAGISVGKTPGTKS